MRLPLAKLHRAFPELDAFSDEECERYILQVQRAGRVSVLAVFGIGAGVALGWCVIGHLIFEFLSQFLARTPFLFRDFVAPMLAPVSAAFVGGIGGLYARDALLARALRKRVAAARCPNCKQSLLGLPIGGSPEKPTLRCPECGELYELGLLGLKPEDIRPRMEPV